MLAVVSWPIMPPMTTVSSLCTTTVVSAVRVKVLGVVVNSDPLSLITSTLISSRTTSAWLICGVMARVVATSLYS